MHSSTEAEPLPVVLRVLAAVPVGDLAGDLAGEAELAEWPGETWRRALLQLPVDRKSFLGRYERPWDAVIDDLGRWCAGFRSRPEPHQQRLERVFGHLGLLLVTLVSLRHADDYRYRRVPGGSGVTGGRSGHDCQAVCAPMLAEAPVREAVRSVYAPGAGPEPEPAEPEADPLSRAEWRRIDFDTLRFHRHGTTSFILTGFPREAIQGKRRPLALKCIVYPFLQVPTIVRATREYQSRYGTLPADAEHVVSVWACSRSWILMDYVAGETLAEHLERRIGPAGDPAAGPPGRRRAGRAAPELRVDLLAELGPPLFTAMSDLERAGLRHQDLTPSNIILRRRDGSAEPWIVFVDLGVNHLYTLAMPGLEGPDATFVAPEVRGGDEGSARADLYSIGRLLTALAGGSDQSGELVPDQFYAETPAMARFLEDLVGRDPEHRLLIFQPDPARPVYPQLRTVFEEELAVMAATRGPGRLQVPGGRLLDQVADLVRPLAGAPARQRRIWRLRRAQQLYRDPRRGMYVRGLLFWSWVSASAWYVGAVVMVTWWLRDLGWDWGNQLISLLQRAAGSSSDEFPYLDALRAPDYPVVDPLGNLPVRLVGASFLLVGARYYQNLFAGLTPLVTGRGQGGLSRRALLAELHMRAQSVAALLFVLPPTLIQRDWWPICTALGILFSFLTNWNCLSFARAALRRAGEQGLSTVPPGRVASLESFGDWTPSAGFYAATCWAIGLLIYFGLVEDVFVYAGAVAAINVVLFYTIKCSGASAANVRIGLGRAFLAAERLRFTAPLPAGPSGIRG
jgi:serine/threonine protein kinase